MMFAPTAELPPHDLEAEATVLSAVMLDPSALAKVQELRPEDFYSEAHRRIFEACLGVSGVGDPLDVEMVRAWLHDHGRLSQVGGAGYLAEVLGAAPVVANVAAYAAGVRRKAHDRAMLSELDATAASLRAGAVDATGASRRLGDRASSLASRYLDDSELADSISVEQLFAPLPPIPFVAATLDLCPGAPAMIAGYGYSGKTVSAQALLLAVAAGRCAWENPELATESGRVVHFDYEQGQRLTAERYQRLARAMGVEPHEIDGKLSAHIYPRMYLDDASGAAEDFYVRRVDGATLALIDSFRAALREGDENDSRVRRHLDMLARVSERTGCTMLAIHHARKPNRNDAGGARTAIRGSGAIFDACSSVFVFDGSEKGGPITVHHEKARTTGRPTESFVLVVEDVEVQGEAEAGLRVGYRVIEAAAEQRKRARVRENAALDAKILAHLQHHGPSSATSAARALGGRKASVLDAIRDLVDRGELQHDEDGQLCPGRGARFPVPPLKGGGNRNRFAGTVGNRPEPVPPSDSTRAFSHNDDREPVAAEE